MLGGKEQLLRLESLTILLSVDVPRKVYNKIYLHTLMRPLEKNGINAKNAL